MSKMKDFRYKAFISYRHVEPDRSFAKWLQKTIETYRIPKNLIKTEAEQKAKHRTGRVFRDDEELAASPDLSKAIDQALQQSEFLIVVCSPQTPPSQWINKEVMCFREMGRHDQILALLIDGEPRESFPPSLCEIRRSITDSAGRLALPIEKVEPLAADVRPKADLSTRQTKRLAKFRILAALLGCQFDALRQRDEERRLKQLVQAVSVLALIIGLISTLAIVAISLYFSEGRARIAEKAAKEQSIWQLGTSLTTKGELLINTEKWLDAYESFNEAFDHFTSIDASPILSLAGFADLNQHELSPISVFELKAPIKCLALSRSAEFAIVGQSDTVQVWNMNSKVAIATLSGHTAEVNCVEISPNGRFAASGGNDSSVRLWDLKTNQSVHEWYKHTTGVTSILFSEDSKFVISGAKNGEIIVWDVESERFSFIYGANQEISDLSISSNGQYLVACSRKLVQIWKIDSNLQPLLELPHDNIVKAAIIGNFGRDCITADEKGNMKVWNLASGQLSKSWLIPQIRDYVTGGRYSVVDVVFDIEMGRAIWSVMYRFGQFGMSQTWFVKEFDLDTGRELGFANDIAAGILSKPHQQQFLSSRDKTLLLWKSVVRHHIRQIAPARTFMSAVGASPYQSDISPDGKFVVAATPKQGVVIFEIASGDIFNTLEIGDGTTDSSSIVDIGGIVETIGKTSDGVRTCQFLNYTQQVVTGDISGEIWLFGVKDGKPVRKVGKQSKPITCIAVNPSNDDIAVVSEDGTIGIWNTRSAKHLHQLRVGDANDFFIIPPNAEYSRDGSLLAAGAADGSVLIWDSATGEEKYRFETGMRSNVVAFSPMYNQILVGGADGTIQLWDTNTGQKLHDIAEHEGSLKCVAFSTDGRIGFSGSGHRHLNTRLINCQLKFWDIQTGKELRSEELNEAVTEINLIPNSNGMVLTLSDFEGHIDIWDYDKVQQHRQNRIEVLQQIKKN